MPQIQTMTIANGEATPVSKDFVPVQGQAGNTIPAIWHDRSPDTYAAYPKLSMLAVRRPTSKSSKVTLKLNVPQQDAEGAVNAEVFIKLECITSDDATLSTKQDAYAFIKHAILTDAVEEAILYTTPAH